MVYISTLQYPDLLIVPVPTSVQMQFAVTSSAVCAENRERGRGALWKSGNCNQLMENVNIYKHVWWK